MNKQEIYISLFIGLLVIASLAILVYAHRKMKNRFKDPDEFLENIEKQISSKLEPKYFVIPELKKAIELYPEHQGLINKLKEVQKSDVSKSSPRTIFLILTTLIALMGFAQVLASVFIKMKIFSLILGIIFIIGAFFLYRKSQKYIKT